MRAKEFVNESELQQLQEKGFWNALGSAALEFGKGAGLLSNTWGELDWLENKLGSKKALANAGAVLQQQIERINAYAEKNPQLKDKPEFKKEYEKAINGAVASLLTRGLSVDSSAPGFNDMVKGIADTAINNPGGLDRAIQSAVKGKTSAAQAPTNPKLKDAKPFSAVAVPGTSAGKSDNNEPALYVQVADNKWEKYVDKDGDGAYSKVEVTPEQMQEFMANMENNQPRQMNLLRADKNTIGFADEKQNKALQKDADIDKRKETVVTKNLNKFVEVIMKRVNEVPDAQKADVAQQLTDRVIANNEMEDANADKLKELVQAELEGGTQEPEAGAEEFVDPGEFTDAVVNFINDNDLMTGNYIKDVRTIKQLVSQNAKTNNIPADQVDQITQNVINAIDPDMASPTPGSADRLEKFSGEVFYPGARDYKGDKRAYVNNDGRWSIFRMAKPGEWEFERVVSSPEGVTRIEQEIADNNLTARPMDFTHAKDDMYKVK